MRRAGTARVSRIALFSLGLACLSPAVAQMTSGTLLLSLRDSRTGAAVRPASVQIGGVEFAGKADASGLIAADLGGGQHQVRVIAPGYVPFDATVTVDGEATPVNTLELDRLTSPGLADESPPLDPRIAVLEGHVVETLQGELISGANVSIAERGAAARTGPDGYFVLTVPVPSASPKGNPVAERVDLMVAREGFVAEERRNVEIVSGTTMTVTVQLDRSTSDSEPVKVVDEGAQDYRLTSWRFDVTVD